MKSSKASPRLTGDLTIIDQHRKGTVKRNLDLVEVTQPTHKAILSKTFNIPDR